MSDGETSYGKNFVKRESGGENRQNVKNNSESSFDDSNARTYPWEELPKPLDAETTLLIEELESDLAALQNFKNASNLIRQEIEKLRFGKEPEYLDVDSPKNITVVKKILVPVQKNPKFNYVGKLLGPGGRTLQQLIQQSRCKIYILGSGSTRSKEKEEEQLASGDPKFAHLAEPLHVRVECSAPVHIVYQRLGRVFEELKHYMVPVRDDIVQQQMADMGIPPGPSSHPSSMSGGSGQRRPFPYRGSSRGSPPGSRGHGGGGSGIQRGNARPYNNEPYNGPQTNVGFGYGEYSEYNDQRSAPSASTNTGPQYASNAHSSNASSGSFPAASHFTYRSASNNPVSGYSSSVDNTPDKLKSSGPYQSGGGGSSYMGSYNSSFGGSSKNVSDEAYYGGYGGYSSGGGGGYGNSSGGGGGYVGTFSSDSLGQYASPGKAQPPSQRGRGISKPSPY